MKFGIGSLIILTLVLIGYLLLQSITTFAAIVPGTAPAGFASFVGVNLTSTDTEPYFANATDDFFSDGNIIFIYANYSCTGNDDCTLLNVTANFTGIGAGGSVNATRGTPCAATHCIYKVNATVNFTNITGGVNLFRSESIAINATNETGAVAREDTVTISLINMSVMPGCPPSGVQLPPQIPLLNGTSVSISGCVTNCTGDDRAETVYGNATYFMCGPNFGGASTNFTQVAYNGNFSNVSFVIDIPNKAKIEFQEGINMSDGDKTQAVFQFAMKNVMSGGRIGVNESEWNGSAGKPNLNLSATLTVYNLSRFGIEPPHMPVLARRASFGSGSFAPCPSTICSGITYQRGAINNFTFTVTSFSEYDITRGLGVVLDTPANFSYLTNSSFVGSGEFRNINFTFTPTWNATTSPDTAALYTNATNDGSWTLNATNTTYLVNNSINGINFTVPSDGAYLWNIVINDTNNVNDTNTINYTVIVDTAIPILINVTPANNSYIKSETQVFQIDATDATLNQTNVTLFRNLPGESGFPSQLLTCYANADVSAYTCNATIDLSSYTEGSQVQYYFEATDNATNFASNGSSSSYYIVTIDDTPPQWSNAGTNATNDLIGRYDAINLSVYWTDNYQLSFALLETNETGTPLNKTSIYNATLSGTTSWSNITWTNSSVSTGTVVQWRVFANDSADNWNVTSAQTFTIESTPPQWSNNVTSPTSGSNYTAGQTYQFNITVTDNIAVDIVVLEFTNDRDTTNYTAIQDGSVYYQNITDLAANTTAFPNGYTYRWFINDTSGNDNSTALVQYLVYQSPSGVTLALNGTSADSTYEKGAVVNQSALSNVTGLTIRIYNDFSGTNVTVGSAATYVNVTNSTSSLSLANYTVSAETIGNTNYTGSSNTTYIVILQDTTVPTVLISSYTNETIANTGTLLTFNVSFSDNDRFLNNTNATITITGTVAGNITNVSAPSWAFGNVSTPSGLSDGLNRINVTVQDATGNIGFNQSFFVNIDNTAPVLNSTVPINNSYIKGISTDVFQINVYDTNLNTSNVTVYFNKPLQTGFPNSNTTTCYNLTSANDAFTCNITWTQMTLTTYTDGSNVTYYFEATDNATNFASNGSSSSYFVVTVDATSPQYSNNATNVTSVGRYDGVLIYANWTDGFSLDFAILETNETGTDLNKTTYSSPFDINQTADQTWSNFTWSNSSLAVGTAVKWRIFANDTAGNWNVTANGTFSIESSWPQVISQSTNTTNTTTIARGTQINISANWTDDTALSYWWVWYNESDTTGTNRSFTAFTSTDNSNSTYNIDTSGFSTGIVFLARFYANDTSGNENQTGTWQWNIDGTKPIPIAFSTNTTNASTIARGTQINISANWTDDIELDRWWVWYNESNTTGANRTFTLFTSTNNSNSTYNIDTSSFGTGIVFEARFYANDTSGNENRTTEGSTTWQWTIDGTGPTPSNVTTDPSSPQEYLLGRSYIFNVSINDAIGVSKVLFEWNGTTNYTDASSPAVINNAGSNYSITLTDLAVSSANYTYRWFANDTSDNWNVSAQYTYNITQNQTNLITFYLNGTENSNLTVRYPAQINATALSNSPNAGTLNIYRNGSSVTSENNTNVRLANATYTYLANISGNVNYTSNTTAEFYVFVIKGITTINLALNGTENNVTYVYPQAINATGWNSSTMIDSQFNLSLYRNDTIVNSSTSGIPIYQQILLANGTYNYTLVFNGSTNYTDTSITNRFAFVNKGPVNVSLWIGQVGSETQGNASLPQGSTLNITATINTTYNVAFNITTDINITSGLYNVSTVGTSIVNSTDTSGFTVADNYNITAHFDGDENFTAGSRTYFLNISGDTTGPTVTIFDDDSGRWTFNNDTARKTGSTFSLNASVTDAGVGITSGEPCNVTIGGTAAGSSTYSSGWCNITVTVPSGLSDGPNLLNITVNDTNDNVGSNATFYITIDNAPPVFSSMPVNGTFNKSDSSGFIWINGTISDNLQMGTGNLTINSTYFNSTTAGAPFSFNGTNNTVFAFRNNTSVPDGYIAVEINYTDNATNIANATVYFYIDNTPPTSFTALTTGTKERNSSQVVEVTVDDGSTGMTNASITLYYKRGSLDTSWRTTTMTGTPATSTTYNATIDTSVLGDGEIVYYYVSGTDNATNSFSTNNGSSTSPLSYFTIGDITPPLQPTNLVAVQVGSTRQVNISWIASTSSDTVSYNIYYERGVVTTSSSSFSVGNVTNTSVTVAQDGTWNFTVTAVDSSNNENTTIDTTASLTVTTTDTTPPVNPASVSVAQVGSTREISISWTASTSTDVTGYNIYYELGGSVTTSSNSTGVGNVTATTMTVGQDGNWNFTVTAHDAVSNENTTIDVAANVSIDTTVPTVTNSGPSGVLTAASTTIWAVTDESSSCYYATADQAISSMTAMTDAGSNNHTTSVSSLANRVHTYYIRCNDTAGNAMTSSAIISFTVNVTSTGSIEGYVLVNGTTTAIEGAIVALNGTSSSAVTSSTGYYSITGLSAAGYALSVSKSGYTTNSTVTVSVSAGSTTTANVTLVAADTVNPIINSVYLNGSQFTAAQPILVTVNATDDTAVTSVTADGATLTQSGDIWNGTVTAGSTLGSHAVVILASDAAGNNATQSVTYEVVSTLDTSGPNITASGPSGVITSSSTTIWAFASENNVICKYDTSYKVFENLSTEMTTSGQNHTASVSDLANRHHVYYVSCNDTAGNTIPTFTIEFTVNVSTTGAIEGYIIQNGSSTTYIVGAIVSLNATGVSATTSGSDGYYYIGGLTAGDYIVMVNKTDYISNQSTATTVTAGSTSQVNVTIANNATGSIDGYVYLTNTSIAPNSSVIRVSDGTRTVSINNVGYFYISSVPAGTYTISASGNGYWTNTTSASLSAGGSTTANIWITGAESFNVTIPGSSTNSYTVNGFLDSGWHTFWLRTGVFGGGTTNYTIPSLFTTIGVAGSYNYSSVWRYNSTAETWSSFIPGTSGNTLINVTSSSELYYVHANATDRVEIEPRYT